MALWCSEINAIVICLIIDDLLGLTAIFSVGLACNFLSFQSDWDGRLLADTFVAPFFFDTFHSGPQKKSSKDHSSYISSS